MSETIAIPDEAVESVAGYLYTARTGIRWHEVDQHGLIAGACRSQARAALEAALPAIRKQVLSEAEAAVVAIRDAKLPLSEAMGTSTYGQLDKAAAAIRELKTAIAGCASLVRQEHPPVADSGRHPQTESRSKEVPKAPDLRV